MRPRGTKKQHVVNVAAKKKEFLRYYAQFGAIHPAAEKIGYNRETILRWRRKDKVFDREVLTALDKNTDLLHITAVSRAMNGTSKGSDTLLMFLLKSRQPEIYRENVDVQHSGTFTLRDFYIFGEGKDPQHRGGSTENEGQPGVVSGKSPRDKGVGKTV